MCSASIQLPRGQKRALDTLELALQAAVSHLICMLGTEPKFSTRAASALDLTPAPTPIDFKDRFMQLNLSCPKRSVWAFCCDMKFRVNMSKCLFLSDKTPVTD